LAGSEELIEFFPKSSVHVIELDSQHFNVWPLAKTLLRGKANQFDYLCEYLKFVKPKLCITLIDTTPHIYRLKSHFPDLQTYSIQNGWRGFETLQELQSRAGELSIDHMFCFGRSAQKMFASVIRGSIHPVGSFRSNKVPVKIELHSRSIALISTLRPKVDLESNASSYSHFRPVKYADIFGRRLLLATYVAEFCRESSMKLMVLGKDFDFEQEQHLYSETLSPLEIEWEFFPRTNLLSSYRHIDRARIVVSTSSSLGYESLARGIRTAFFMIDPEVTGNWGDKFGWPESLEDQGPIWANYLDRLKTLEVLRTLNDASDGDWLAIRERFVPQLISHDPNNSHLSALLNKALQTVGQELP
jgi:surface carbohydrate biosynthesis protein